MLENADTKPCNESCNKDKKESETDVKSLLGMNDTTLDSKHRLSLPSSFKDCVFSDFEEKNPEFDRDAPMTVYAMLALSPCKHFDLFFSKSDLDYEIKKREEEHKNILHAYEISMIHSCITRIQLDKNFRTNSISSTLLEFSKVDGELVVTGGGHFISVYNKKLLYESIDRIQQKIY